MDPDTQVRYVEGVLGPHEVGVMVAIYLLGLMTMQTYTYFRTYPEDTRGTKLLVAFIWSLLLSHTIISSFALYQRTVIEFGVMANIEQYPAAMCAAFSISGLIGAVVQSFFANRLRIFSEQWTIPVICWVLSLARFGSLLCLSVTSYKAPSVTEYIHQSKWLVILAMSISAIVDAIIAGSLSYCLWSRSKDILKQSQKAVDRIIMYTMQTGLLTGFSSILMLILFLSVENFAWVAVYLIISGVFANYLLFSLNARRDFRDGMNKKPTFLDIETVHNLEHLRYPPLSMTEIDYSSSSSLHPQSSREHTTLSLPTVAHVSEPSVRTSMYMVKSYVNSPAIV